MRKLCILSGVLIYLIISSFPALAGAKPPEEGEVLPEIILPVPQKPELKKYLGLSGEGSFSIPQVKADVVLIEIFSMYCPYCQREAPAVNTLYGKIETSSRLKEKIKLIGIGAGNSEFEVDIFRKQYAIEFPLLPDNDFVIHKMLGEVRTPYFIGVKLDKGGKPSIFYSKLGSIGDPDNFLSLIEQRAGL